MKKKIQGTDIIIEILQQIDEIVKFRLQVATYKHFQWVLLKLYHWNRFKRDSFSHCQTECESIKAATFVWKFEILWFLSNIDYRNNKLFQCCFIFKFFIFEYLSKFYRLSNKLASGAMAHCGAVFKWQFTVTLHWVLFQLTNIKIQANIGPLMVAIFNWGPVKS